MNINLFLTVVFSSAVLLADSSGTSLDYLNVDYQHEALSSSFRCMRTIRGDETRIALTQNFVSENLCYLNLPKQAYAALKESAPHYALPFGCAESALIMLGKGDLAAVHDMISLGLDLLPYAAGRGGELAQFQLLKIAAVSGDGSAVQRSLDAEKITKVDLRESYRLFLVDWKPNVWNRLLAFIKPARPWENISKDLSREEQVQWHAKRAVDVFTAILFIRECEFRVITSRMYPAHLIEFAFAGAKSESFNTRNALIQLELARLASIEKKESDSLRLIEEALKLLTPWAPHMSGIYPIERDLAVLLSRQENKGDLLVKLKERLTKRVEILKSVLDPYEQMIQLPFLAEGFYVLGFINEANAAWSTAADLCAKNKNPEGQSIGLTRIWMSFARANCLPEKTTAALLQKIETKLPEEYSKVHF